MYESTAVKMAVESLLIITLITTKLQHYGVLTTRNIYIMSCVCIVISVLGLLKYSN